MTLNKLNLGCGQFRKEGYINVDVSPHAQADVLHNLDTYPYPFETESFDLIEADHVLEHLADPFRTMTEITRILKPGGQIHLCVPHFSRGFTHPEHQRGFDITFPYYFQPDFPGGYTGTHLLLETMRLHWMGQPYLMKQMLPFWLYYLARGIGRILDYLANLSPIFCSRLWCFWVGGFYEIEFVFEKPVTAKEDTR